MGLPRQGVGLVGLLGKDVAAELGRLLEQGIEVFLNGDLLGPELVDRRLGAGACGERLFASRQVAQPLELGVAAAHRVEPALELVEPLAQSGRAGSRPGGGR